MFPSPLGERTAAIGGRVRGLSSFRRKPESSKQLVMAGLDPAI